jgi:putative ABC transport system permease protein
MRKKIQIIYIAYKNIFRNKMRSLVIGSAVVISTFLLLLTNSVASGVNYKILKDQINIDSGYINVQWKDEYKFKQQMTGKEKAEQANLIDFIKKQPQVKDVLFDDIGKVQMKIKKSKPVDAELMAADFKKEGNRLGESVLLLKGTWPETKGEVMISEKYADQYTLKIGSHFQVAATSLYGEKNTVDCTVCGIYKNGTPWHESYLYSVYGTYNQLFNGAQIYTTVKIITDDSDSVISALKSQLNQEVKDKNYPFVIKDYKQEAGMYNGFSQTTRAMFNTLNFILIFIIILGIQSIIILAVNDRNKEFATMRALGFYRGDINFLLFSEYLIIALISCLIGVILSIIAISIIQTVGIPLHSEVLTYLFGNDYLYPVVSISDFILTFVMVFAFVMLAVLPQTFKKYGIAGRDLT